ncbi:hypothetical protein C414_000350019 [Campylobacter jejuni subsp. jejuni 414]|nr:hypothetical protein C414_000350019 [Campylobacter jejuni subsp. jejuni 414]
MTFLFHLRFLRNDNFKEENFEENFESFYYFSCFAFCFLCGWFLYFL